MSAWRLAESLKKLREQLNAAYPNRDKSSDGSIGDEAHASRKSDHNPWVKDFRGIGVVTAIDIDADLAPGVSVEALVKQLFLTQDPRIKYIIWKRKITLPGLTGWKAYTGSNAHTHHCHISVHSDSTLYDSRREWNLGLAVIGESGKLKAESGKSAESAVEAPAGNPTVSESGQVAATEPAEKPAEVQAQPPINKMGETGGEQPVELRKERPSAFTKLAAGFSVVIGFFSSMGIGLQTAFDRIATEITGKQIIGVLIGAGIGAAGLYFYDRSAQRSNLLNEQKIEKAADTKSNTVELT